MGHKYFISYSRSVKEDVRKVIDLLKASGQEIWWDANLPKIADWWSTILDHIEWCEICIFVVSAQSVKSSYCLEELRYASARKRPILFFIIDNLDPNNIPDEIKATRNQWLIYDGNPATMLNDVLTSVGQLKWERYKDVPVARPPEPNTGGISLIRQFQQAVELAEESNFEEALKKFRNVGGLDYHKWGEDCHEWEIKIRSYLHILELADNKSTLKKARKDWEKYKEKYEQEDEFFDPQDLRAKFKFDELEEFVKLVQWSDFTQAPSLSINFRQAGASLPLGFFKHSRLRLSARDILPAPFLWISIPAGKVNLNVAIPGFFAQETPYNVSDFFISKYPITNAQYAKFVEAQGYDEIRWWQNGSWEIKENEKWKMPRYWMDMNWNTTDHPVVGISLFEALAFCEWLKDVSGEIIYLPNEQQWQRAAQGDTDLTYPWGDEWDSERCNNSVTPNKSVRTTPVQQYEGLGKGNSPYGVVDLSGNVWEWCNSLLDLEESEEDETGGFIMRGGSWKSDQFVVFNLAYRYGKRPTVRNNLIGFRIARMP